MKRGVFFRSRGFTLMEIVVAITIIVAFTSVVGRGIDGFFSAQRVTTAARTFIEDYRAARFGAMNDQRYYRLYFSSDNFNYVVQSYDSAAKVAATHVTGALTNINDANWTTVIDEPMREIDPYITFQRPSSLNVMFFRFDGAVVAAPTEDAAPIQDCVATFTYGLAALAVNISSSGTMASEEFYEPD